MCLQKFPVLVGLSVVYFCFQDPVLFSGTFRYNLDPLSEYTDEQLWNALAQVRVSSIFVLEDCEHFCQRSRPVRGGVGDLPDVFLENTCNEAVY